jgi:hypothetical protein
MIDLYANRGDLSQSELLDLIENAEPVEKGKLSELYARRHFDLGVLHHFPTPNGTRLLIDPLRTRPFFLLFSPGAKVEVRWYRNDAGLEQTFTVGDSTTRMPAHSMGESAVVMPGEPGVYPARDTVNGKTWGWVLVR